MYLGTNVLNCMQLQRKNDAEYITEKYDNSRNTKCNSPVIAGGGGGAMAG
jgi:hypothetical protein